MNKIFTASLIIIVIISAFIGTTFTSCTKETIKYDTVTVTKRDTTIVTKHDTTVIVAKDTVLPIDVNSWNAYSYYTKKIVAPDATTYFNTSEGIKFLAQAPRYGLRLETKVELGITGKVIYYKWKGNGMGQFAQFVPQLKYDPYTTDSLPPVQDVDFPDFTTNNTFNSSTLIQNDVWYYTRIKAIPGTDNYECITATGNYDNSGGTVIVDRNVPVYTKHGYIALRIGDTFATNTYCVLAECKIASN